MARRKADAILEDEGALRDAEAEAKAEIDSKAEIEAPQEAPQPEIQHSAGGAFGSVGGAPPAVEKDLAAEAYDLFCKGQSEGEYPAWAELPPQTQKLWRDAYKHVAEGGKPRTDYEHAVKYLIVSAQ